MTNNTNHALQLANDFVRYTNENIFLTGKAGTGKTTFLHNLKDTLAKRFIITAPTGVAAINAGGVTLHSFFQIPFAPFVPGSEGYQQAQQRRFSKQKINIIRTLDLLIIDEISMVRADVLDAIDAVLRRYKFNNTPFGGVQLLMIGDLHQLAPVVKDDEWDLLKAHYNSCYFFSSHALQGTQLNAIELQHIYRQSEPQFIELLNHVRENRLDSQTLEVLNSRYQADFQSTEEDGFITLTTHNYSADNINNKHLNQLNNEVFCFTAEVQGNYSEYNYPTAERLCLKQGAQVMFVRNDSSPDKLYYNGKIGKVVRIEQQMIVVQCPDDEDEIIVEPALWENIKYTINPNNQQISEDVIGTFQQYPLRLAWAITIHKSQGLTFEKAIIDAAGAFSHGQVYVALSRCKTFEGMVLSSPINQQAVHTDGTIAQFVDHISDNPPTQQKLHSAQTDYQHKLISECFDFYSIQSSFNFLSRIFFNNQSVIHTSSHSSIENTLAIDLAIEQVSIQADTEIFKVSDKFKHQLHSIIAKINTSDQVLPEDDPHLQERIVKASAYFSEKLEQGLKQWAFSIYFSTDNKDIAKKIKRAMEFLQHNLSIKQAALESCQKSFSSTCYLQAIAKAEINFKAQSSTKKDDIDYFSLDIKHPELFESLKKWRTEQADKEGVGNHQILHQRVMIQIAIVLPDSHITLKKIKGIGKRTLEKYAETIIELVADYCQKNNIATNQPMQFELSDDKTKTLQNTPSDTQQMSFELYQSGKSIDEIAQERGFINSTIENHLAYFIERGKLEIMDFVNQKKTERIQASITENGPDSLKVIKEDLGDDYSYGEIRMVMAHLIQHK